MRKQDRMNPSILIRGSFTRLGLDGSCRYYPLPPTKLRPKIARDTKKRESSRERSLLCEHVHDLLRAEREFTYVRPNFSLGHRLGRARDLRPVCDNDKHCQIFRARVFFGGSLTEGISFRPPSQLRRCLQRWQICLLPRNTTLYFWIDRNRQDISNSSKSWNNYYSFLYVTWHLKDRARNRKRTLR